MRTGCTVAQMTTFKFYFLSSLGATILKGIFPNWKMFAKEGLGLELKDTRKDNQKKKTCCRCNFFTQRKTCKEWDECWSSEAFVRRCSVKKVFLKISQNSQENTCARVSF